MRILNEEYLSHHGIKGQKWGVRRFQNPDGTLTQAGKQHRSESGNKSGIDKEKLKKVGKAVAIGAAVGIGAAYVARSGLLTAAANDAAIYGAKSVISQLGKDYIDKTMNRKIMKEVVTPAVKKVAVGAAQGVVIAATTKALEKAVGKENADAMKQAYNAYNKKNKIGQVPDLFGNNKLFKEDDDDDE